MNTVVQLISFPSIYNTNLQKELLKYDKFNQYHKLVEINLEEEINCYDSSFERKNKLAKVLFLLRFNKHLEKKYKELKGSVVNIQYVSILYFFLLPFICKIFSRIVLSFWGSDLLRQSTIPLCLIKKLCSKADLITFETAEMKRIFRERVGTGNDDKIRLVKFGASQFELIDSITENDIEMFCSRFHIDRHRKIITIGYNRKREQQHVAAIESMLNNGVPKEKCFIILPWAYGLEGTENEAYANEITNAINSKYDYVFINDFLFDKDVACLRHISDILVQVQTTDSFSFTMLETLYAKNEVLTGEWLPYEELDERGVVLTKVGHPADVGKAILDMIEEPVDEAKREKNREIIFDMLNWEKNIVKWNELYGCEHNGI